MILSHCRTIKIYHNWQQQNNISYKTFIYGFCYFFNSWAMFPIQNSVNEKISKAFLTIQMFIKEKKFYSFFYSYFTCFVLTFTTDNRKFPLTINKTLLYSYYPLMLPCKNTFELFAVTSQEHKDSFTIYLHMIVT